MTKDTWNTFVEARYAGLVKAASTIVGQANAADAVLGALLRAATTKTYLNCRIDPFTWVLSAVTSVAASSPRGVRTHRAVDALFEHRAANSERGIGAVPTPRPELGAVGALVNLKRLDRQVEIQLALTLAGGQAVTGVTMDDVHAMNAKHAQDNAAITRQEAIELLRKNSAPAAAAIRAFTDEQLASAGTNSLYADAPLTCQHMLEDHAVRHSYHHLGKIRAALKA